MHSAAIQHHRLCEHRAASTNYSMQYERMHTACMPQAGTAITVCRVHCGCRMSVSLGVLIGGPDSEAQKCQWMCRMHVQDTTWQCKASKYGSRDLYLYGA